MPERVNTSTVSPMQDKVKKVMGEFKSGKLFSSSGDKVTNPEQAIAIAISEGKKLKHEDNSVPIAVESVSKETELLPIREAVVREIQRIGQERFDSIDPEMMLEIPDVMLFTTGVFKGIATTEMDLKAKEIAAHELSSRPPIVKITHADKNEQSKDTTLKDFPFSVGEVAPETVRTQGSYLGGLVKIFKWVADYLAKGYLRSSSAEIKHNLKTQDGKTYPRVLDALALLGSKREAQWETLNAYEESKDSYESIVIYEYEELKQMDKENEIPQAETPSMPESESMPNPDYAEVSEGFKSYVKDYMEGCMKKYMDDMKMYMEETVKSSVSKYMEGMMGEPKPEMEVNSENYQEETIPDSFKVKYEEMESKLKTLEAEKEKEKALRIESEDKNFIDNLVKESKLAPSLSKKAFALLNKSSEELIVAYSDGENEVSKSQKEQFKDFLSSLEKSVLYSENELAEGSDEFDNISVTEEDRKLYGGRTDQEIMQEKKNTAKVYKYMEDNSCSFEQAVEIIFKKG